MVYWRILLQSRKDRSQKSRVKTVFQSYHKIAICMPIVRLVGWRNCDWAQPTDAAPGANAKAYRSAYPLGLCDRNFKLFLTKINA
jgi:hypothetical protein